MALHSGQNVGKYPVTYWNH